MVRAAKVRPARSNSSALAAILIDIPEWGDGKVSVQPSRKLYDLQALMERPFFALAQKPLYELKPYRRNDLTLEVRATSAEFGVATIRDVDVLIYLASVMIAKEPETGAPDQLDRIRINASELLSSVGRSTGGGQYRGLHDALRRLQLTEYTTNIGPNGKRAEPAQFSLVTSWEEDARGIDVELHSWFATAVRSKAVLQINAEYFKLRPGLERWLYRTARKHAGTQANGYAFSMPILYEKSGATAPYKRFVYELRTVISNRDCIPDYAFELWPALDRGGVDRLNMIRRKRSY